MENDQFPIDVNLFSEINKNALVDALNSVNGAKTLVIDSYLSGALNLVTDVSVLKQHGVEKMFWLERGALTPPSTNVIYLCKAVMKNAKIIAGHIKQHAKESKKFVYTVLLVPRVSALVSQIFEEEGVLGDITISSYNLQFIPLAPDLISLENDRALRDIWVVGDETVVYDSLLALETLQKHHGSFPRIVGKGDHAARLANLLERQAAKSTGNPNDNSTAPSNTMDCLIILDRRIDMITPLLTQLTYEGLIDEAYGLKNSQAELPASLFTPAVPATSSNMPPIPNIPKVELPGFKVDPKKKHRLTASTDSLYGELRDLNFAAVGKKLNLVARKLEKIQKTDLQSKTVAQLRDLVGILGDFQSQQEALRFHTGLSELIAEYTQNKFFVKSLRIQQDLLASVDPEEQVTNIEDLMAEGANLYVIIRLLSLACLTSGGAKFKTLEYIKAEFLQVYGYQYLPLILALSDPSIALLVTNPIPAEVKKYPFEYLRKTLRLLIDDTPESREEVENDISYVYSGYAPISVRLVQCVAQKGGVLSNPAEKEKSTSEGDASAAVPATKVPAHPIVGWKGFEDVVAAIPGATVDIVRAEADPASTSGTKVTVVFFVGGCTYTEIAALRWVGRQHQGRKFLIATTGILSGNSVMDSIMDLAAKAND